MIEKKFLRNKKYTWKNKKKKIGYKRDSIFFKGKKIRSIPFRNIFFLTFIHYYFYPEWRPSIFSNIRPVKFDRTLDVIRKFAENFMCFSQRPRGLYFYLSLYCILLFAIYQTTFFIVHTLQEFYHQQQTLLQS